MSSWQMTHNRSDNAEQIDMMQDPTLLKPFQISNASIPPPSWQPPPFSGKWRYAKIISKVKVAAGIWISLSRLAKLACKFLHNESPPQELLFLLPSKLQVVFSSNLFVVCKGHTSCTEAKLWCCWKIEFFFPVRGYYCMLSPWNWKWEIPVSQKFQKKYDAAYIFWSDF